MVHSGRPLNGPVYRPRWRDEPFISSTTALSKECCFFVVKAICGRHIGELRNRFQERCNKHTWDFLTKKGLDTRATGTANVRSLGDPRMHANGNALPVEQRTVQLAGPEGTRLHFSGPPSGLTGTIPLVNTGPDKQKIRTVAVNVDIYTTSNYASRPKPNHKTTRETK